MNSKVIVLGAGASHSFAESPTGQRPPLAKEIISTFHKLSISMNRLVLVGSIINYVRDTRGISPIEFETWDEDAEKIFTEVDETLHILAEERAEKGEGMSEKSLRHFMISASAYNELVFLFTSILNEIQNGPVSIPYALLASLLSPIDSVLNFNWDTLMDRAMFSAGKWHPCSGYLVNPKAVFQDGWRESDKFDVVNGSPQYIKLHGSTNWLVPWHGRRLDTGRPDSLGNTDDFYAFMEAGHPYKTFKGRYWGPYQPFSYCYYPPNLPGCSKPARKGYKFVRFTPITDLGPSEVNEDNDVYAMPLIIPPVRNKQYERYGKIFSQLWGGAEKAVSECQKLILIGYSFPDTDLLAKDMFERAILKNKNLSKVIIVNPSPEKVKEIFTQKFLVPDAKISVMPVGFESLIFNFKKVFED